MHLNVIRSDTMQTMHGWFRLEEGASKYQQKIEQHSKVQSSQSSKTHCRPSVLSPGKQSNISNKRCWAPAAENKSELHMCTSVITTKGQNSLHSTNPCCCIPNSPLAACQQLLTKPFLGYRLAFYLTLSGCFTCCIRLCVGEVPAHLTGTSHHTVCWFSVP